MRKIDLHRIILYVVGFILLLTGLAGCNRGNEIETESQQTESELEVQAAQYMILSHDMQAEMIGLYSYSNGKEYYFEYGFPTEFKDKYGNYASSAEFVPGRVVTIAPRDKDNYLTEVQLSDYVWEYEDVHRFRIEEEKGILTIADTKYSIRDEVKIFSGEEEIAFSDISEDDILTVIGNGRKIMSIIVTTGHGTLSLKNTEVFEESFLQLNNDIFAMITPDMELEVPEGEYTLKVANDGWGGSTTIEIVRGETTEIDLETLKGEGKKKGLISFRIDVEDVKVYVDYQLIDHSQPVELTYGVHVLQIEASGYETWKKYLSVNSQEATLLIELTEDESEEEEETESTEKEETESTQEEGTESLETTEI